MGLIIQHAAASFAPSADRLVTHYALYVYTVKLSNKRRVSNKRRASKNGQVPAVHDDVIISTENRKMFVVAVGFYKFM
jgi:hypothetical protein